VVELVLEPLDDDFSDDFSDDEDDEPPVDSEPDPLDELDELFAALLAESRLSVR
jgi:hypothetical protein